MIHHTCHFYYYFFPFFYFFLRNQIATRENIARYFSYYKRTLRITFNMKLMQLMINIAPISIMFFE